MVVLQVRRRDVAHGLRFLVGSITEGANSIFLGFESRKPRQSVGVRDQQVGKMCGTSISGCCRRPRVSSMTRHREQASGFALLDSEPFAWGRPIRSRKLEMIVFMS